MKRSSIFCFLIFVALVYGCSKDDKRAEETDFPTLYGGIPFKGSAEGIRSVSGNETHRWTGEGRIALIEATPDSVSLVFMADFEDVAEINMKIRGAYEQKRFWVSGSNVDFSITDGRIGGNSTSEQQKILLSGSISPTSSTVSIRVEFLEGQEGFPAGSALELHLETQREPDTDNGEGCKMRLVPIWSPSGMTMGMVPDC